jgi:hypothetical protein
MANIGVPVDPVDGMQKDFQQHATPVGAGLLANSVCHSTLIPTDTASSRASPLPQGVCGGLAGEGENDKARTRRALGFE